MCVVGIGFRAEDSSSGMQPNPGDPGAAIWGSCHPSTEHLASEVQGCLCHAFGTAAWYLMPCQEEVEQDCSMQAL